ncbi:MAG: glycosyltransferase domain-containing protein, partial [Gemmatimonadales bacterium]
MSAASAGIYHFTWSPTADDVRLRLFAISCRRAGFQTKFIRCASTNDKPATLVRAIASLDDKSVICCTDSFDILCTNTPATVLEAFRASGHDIVFGAERAPYHHFVSSVECFNSASVTSPYRYLNGGVFTGYAGAVRDMLADIAALPMSDDDRPLLSSQEDDVNDQTVFGRYAATHREAVALDRNATICWNLFGELDAFCASLESSADPFVNPATGMRPAFLHVSHLRKYYPAYLWAARRLGLPINGRTVNLRLFDHHIEGVIPEIDGPSIPPDPETSAILKATIEY